MPVSQVRVVLLAAVPLDRLFVHSGGEDERDRQLLDDLGLSGVRSHLLQQKLKQQENHHLQSKMNGTQHQHKPELWKITPLISL